MVKLAFQSYLSAIHPRNIKLAQKGQAYFWIIYWIILYPAIMLNLHESPDSELVVVSVIAKLLPWGLMLWSNATSKFMMPKMMYLCPMTYEDRKEYINGVLLVKIGVPVILGLVIDILWSCFFGWDVVRMLFCTFAYISIGIATYFCVTGKGKNDTVITMGKKLSDGTIKPAWTNNWMIGIALGILVIFALEGINDEKWNLVAGILLALFTGILIALDVLIVKRHYQSTIEGVSDYEANFNIKTEVSNSQDVTFDLFAKKKEV